MSFFCFTDLSKKRHCSPGTGVWGKCHNWVRCEHDDVENVATNEKKVVGSQQSTLDTHHQNNLFSCVSSVDGNPRGQEHSVPTTWVDTGLSMLQFWGRSISRVRWRDRGITKSCIDWCYQCRWSRRYIMNVTSNLHIDFIPRNEREIKNFKTSIDIILYCKYNNTLWPEWNWYQRRQWHMTYMFIVRWLMQSHCWRA